MSKSRVIGILRLWPDRASVWEDARVADETLSIVAVHRWFQRGSVPARYWKALLAGAKRRGLAVTADDLVAAHAVRREAAG
jgi:hypothetical protein